MCTEPLRDECCEDGEFLRLLATFNARGGLVPWQPSVVFSIRPACVWWRGQYWAPCQQFQDGSDQLRPSLPRLLTELRPVFEGADLLRWLAEPNAWLHDRAPLDVLEEAPELVCEAARIDRFIAS